MFVCSGNICRSPTAEGVARAIAAERGEADQFVFDSAGIEGYHVGEAPDPRAQARARLRGYDLSNLRARRVTARDFDEFDLILAMDRSHLERLESLCPESRRHKVKLFLSDALRGDDRDVPDPYYGDTLDFDHVLDLCEEALRSRFPSRFAKLSR